MSSGERDNKQGCGSGRSVVVSSEVSVDEADGVSAVVALEAIERPREALAGEELWSGSVPLGRAGGGCCAGGLSSVCGGPTSSSMDDGDRMGCGVEECVAEMLRRKTWCCR